VQRYGSAAGLLDVLDTLSNDCPRRSLGYAGPAERLLK